VSFDPFKVKVPASTANLGAGFDCLGLALSIWNEVEVRPADKLAIRVEGEGAGSLAKGEENLVWKTFREFFERVGEVPPTVELVCRNRIPLARGLGSSAAVRVSALVAARHSSAHTMEDEELLQIAAHAEGHPDNVAPALLGGLVVCGRDGDSVVTQRIEPAAGVRAVLLIPESTLETSEARMVLPTQVPFADAVSNLQNAALTTAAFLTGEYELLRSSLDDCLHQPYRKKLMPGFDETLEAARKAGAYGAALSGAGPTLVAFTSGNEERIAQAMTQAFTQNGGGACRTEVADIDLKGAVVESLD
jgi:homoserine kinase